jgi:hypothetical protein
VLQADRHVLFVLSNADKTPVDTHRFEASDPGKNLLRCAQKSFPNSSLNSESYVSNTVIGPYSRFGKYLLVLAFIDLLLGPRFGRQAVFECC